MDVNGHNLNICFNQNCRNSAAVVTITSKMENITRTLKTTDYPIPKREVLL